MIKRCTGKATKIRFLSIQKNKEKTFASYMYDRNKKHRNTRTWSRDFDLLDAVAAKHRDTREKSFKMLMYDHEWTGQNIYATCSLLVCYNKSLHKNPSVSFSKNKTSTTSSMIYGGIINNNNNFLLEKKGQTQFWPTRIFICFPTIKVLTLDFKKKMTGIF